MPQQERTHGDKDKGPQPAKEVKDPGDANQRKQIEQINSARDDVREVRNRVVESSVTGRLNTRVANTAYREVITSYALLLAPYLRSERFGDPELWEGRDEPLATVSIRPPKTEDIDVDIESISPESGYQLDIDGVKEFINTPTPISVNFDGIAADELRGQNEVTVPKTAEIGRQALDEIVIALDEFRIGMGLGLKLPDIVEDRSDEPF